MMVKLIRAYASLMKYTNWGIQSKRLIKSKGKFNTTRFKKPLNKQVEILDFKRFEPGMRQLMDIYLDANSSKKISDFENKSLLI